MTSRLIQIIHSISWPQGLLPAGWGVGSYDPPGSVRIVLRTFGGWFDKITCSFLLDVGRSLSPGVWWWSCWDHEGSRKQLGKQKRNGGLGDMVQPLTKLGMPCF